MEREKPTGGHEGKEINMFGRILKKDLKRKKGINFILFLFITIATVFLASSVNNMLVVSNATAYFLDKVNMPDEFVTVLSDSEGPRAIEEWLDEESSKAKQYGMQRALMIQCGDLKIIQDGKEKEYDTKNTIYLQTNPKEYVKVFDAEGNPITIEDGETAVSLSEANAQGLKVGDQIEIKNGQETERFTIKALVKDALYAGDMSGMIRFLLSDADYKRISQNDKLIEMTNYFVQTNDLSGFEKSYNKQKFVGSPNVISIETVKMLFVMDLIVAGMLTVIGICLIAIAVLVLRFTIVFTIEGDYREIGIMKAIGLKNGGIKRLYLVKYFALVLAGSAIGCLASFPIGNFMLESVSVKMLMEDSSRNWIINVICALIVVVLVLVLCYLSMRKLNKFSAIDAIRSGQNGERYQKKSPFRLHNRKKMQIPVFLAVNDIVSNYRRYIVLLLVFAVGIVLMIVPFNTINTMKGPEMAKQFSLDTDADVFLSEIEKETGEMYGTTKDLEEGLKLAADKLEEKGYKADLESATIFFVSYEGDGKEDGLSLLTQQPIGGDGSYLTYTEGKAPLLSNEIAISQKAMDEMGVGIGDTVKATLLGKEMEFIITGTYQDYMQLGKSARMNPAIDLSDQVIYEYWTIQVYLDHDNSRAIAGKEASHNQEVLIEQMSKDFPNYKFQSAREIVNGNVGGIVGIIENMRIWLIALMAGINMMITTLMMKMFMMSEKGEVAMLKSIGFRTKAIRVWQTLRIAGISLVSVFVAIPLSKVVDYFVLRPVFGIMGAEMNITVIPLEVYAVYPLVLFVAILVAAAFSSASVKKIDIRELSNLE